MKDLLIPALTVILGIIAAFFSYHWGKKTEKIKLLLGKALPLAEEIVQKVNRIESLYKLLYGYFTENFGHIEPFERQIEAFEKLSNTLHIDAVTNIKELMKERDELIKTVEKSYLYLNYDSLKIIEKYYHIGNFTYADDDFFYSEFYPEFWANLLDQDNLRLRAILYVDILKDAKYMLPK